MTVEIDWERSEIVKPGEECSITTVNPDNLGGDTPYTIHAFAKGSEPQDSMSTWWTWENPGEPLRDVTLSPSIILHFGDSQQFHIYLRGGEIEHLGDCQCGCE